MLNKANELASNYTAHFANGTAHVRGTAFAKGSIVSSGSAKEIVSKTNTQNLEQAFLLLTGEK